MSERPESARMPSITDLRSEHDNGRAAEVPYPMNRFIMGGLNAIAIYCILGTWGVFLFILWRTGHSDLAFLPTLVLVLIGIGLWNRAREEANAPEPKTCPDCAEEVLPAANVCKHCGYRFSATSN